MKRPHRIIAWLLLPPLLLLAAAAAWLTWIFDPDDYRARLGSWLSRHSGLHIRIDGPLEYRLLDNLILKARDVRLYRDEVVLADLESLRADIPVSALWSGGMEIATLHAELRRLELSALRAAASATVPNARSGDAAAGIVIHRFELRIGELAWGTPASRIQGLELSLTPLELPLPRFFAAPRHGELRAAAVTSNAVDLRNLTLSFETGPATLLLRELGAELTTTLPADATARIRGDADLRFEGTSWRHGLRLDRLSLELNQGRIASPNGPYNLRSGRLQTGGLTLASNAETRAPDRLYRLTPDMHLDLELNGFSHRERHIESLSLQLRRRDGDLVIQDLEMQIANTRLRGDGRLELQRTPMPWELHLASTRIALAPLMAFFNSPYEADGDLELDLFVAGAGLAPDSLSGHLHLRGRDLQMSGVDMDEVLTHLDKSRRISLVDIGAYALGGPAGALLSKGTDYSRLVGSVSKRGHTRIRELLSEVDIDSGVARIKDVAISTQRHRLAVRGSLVPRRNGALDLQIARVDADGCAVRLQQVGGTLAKPEVSQAPVVVTGVVDPIKSLVSGVVGTLTRNCPEPFYQGRVKPPPAEAEVEHEALD